MLSLVKKSNKVTFILTEGVKQELKIIIKNFHYDSYSNHNGIKVRDVATKTDYENNSQKLYKFQKEIEQFVPKKDIASVSSFRIMDLNNIIEDYITISGKDFFFMLNNYSLIDRNTFLNKMYYFRDKCYQIKRKKATNPLQFDQHYYDKDLYKKILTIYKGIMLNEIRLKDYNDLYYLLNCLYNGCQRNCNDIDEGKKLVDKYLVRS